jgi:hypothetical protein
MSLHLFPPEAHLAQVHDDPQIQTVTEASREIRAEITNAHPLQNRLTNWAQNQQALKRELKMNVFGRAAGVDQMERDIVQSVKLFTRLVDTNTD